MFKQLFFRRFTFTGMGVLIIALQCLAINTPPKIDDLVPMNEITIQTDGCSFIQKFPYGANIQIQAMPIENYHLKQWSDGVADNPRIFIVEKDSVIRAIFESDDALIDTIVIASSKGLANSSGSGTYKRGVKIDLSITPIEGYKFVSWSDGNTKNPRSVVVSGNKTYVPIFSPISTNAATRYTVKYCADGCEMLTQTYVAGTMLCFIAKPKEGYYFSKWADGNIENPRVVSISSDSSFIAFFDTIGNLGSRRCSVQFKTKDCPNSQIIKIPIGAQINMTAIANDCSKYVKWLDDNTSNPRTIHITQDSTFTAIFERIRYKLSINLNDAEHGEIEAKETNK